MLLLMAPGRCANRLVDVQPPRPADWLAMLTELRTAPTEAQRLARLVDSLLLRWQRAS